MIGIYKFTFSNGHYYIGQGINLKRRELQHIREMNKQRHTNKRVQNCFNKYGLPSFEVLEECDREDLNSIETKYISDNILNDNFCNICTEGKSRKGVKSSEETKCLIKNYQYASGKNKPVYIYSRDEMFLLGKFRSIREAEQYIGCSPKSVQTSCKSNGHYNVGKYKFKYASHADILLNSVKQIVKL
jgi:hypothetical protein